MVLASKVPNLYGLVEIVVKAGVAKAASCTSSNPIIEISLPGTVRINYLARQRAEY